MRVSGAGRETGVVDCSRWVEAISADLDGELADAERAALVRHVAGCPDCGALDEELRLLHRAVRLRPAEAVPDLSEQILAVANPPRAGRGEWIRTALLIVALTQAALSVPDLLGRTDGTTIHVARHLGSLEVAFALGLLYAVWRPVRAFGLLPMAGALAVGITTTAVLDTVQGRTEALREAHHLLELTGLVLLWSLAGAPRPWGRRGPVHQPTRRRHTVRAARSGEARGDDAWSDAS